MAEGAARHSLGAHPHSAHRIVIFRFRGRAPDTSLPVPEDDDHQDNQNGDHRPSKDPVEGDPEEGDDGETKDTKEILCGDRHGARSSGPT